jgi:hypothetical protein
MRTFITATAMLATLGSGAALAQGVPPGFAAWQSGWPRFIESQRGQSVSPSEASTTRDKARTMASRRNGPAPVASNTQGTHRGS